MKRLGNIWRQLTNFKNLLSAYRKARRGKAKSLEVVKFELNLESHLLSLQRELQDGTYTPGQYRLFTIYERKPRQIAAAPFRDRIVHHVVMNCIEPVLDRTFITDSYACRKGKGVHAAVSRYQQWSRSYAYALKLDVAQYFASINHARLKFKLRQRIKDARTLSLLETIIDYSPQVGRERPPEGHSGSSSWCRAGIPIGNLTSQFFANLYLDGLDHYIKQQLLVRPYLRYVDDMVLLDNDKNRLADLRDAIKSNLNSEGLRLHPRKAHISPTVNGLNLLGYMVFPQRRQLRNDNGYRFQRRLRRFAKDYAEGRLDWEDFNPSVQSWIGHARHADSYGLRRNIFSHTVFRRGADHEAAGV